LPLLSERQQAILLDMVKNILHIDKKEKHISVEQYNKEIEQAIKQVQNGESTTHADIVKQSAKWFKRK
jgi:phage anti-repressor protein